MLLHCVTESLDILVVWLVLVLLYGSGSHDRDNVDWHLSRELTEVRLDLLE